MQFGKDFRDRLIRLHNDIECILNYDDDDDAERIGIIYPYLFSVLFIWAKCP